LIWDKWIELHGYELDSIYAVADTNIGRIGLIFCQEGDYPEPARGLAMNGAEIIYRASAPEPAVSRGWWEIQNRARALDNTCYMVAPNVASYLVHPEGTGPVDNFGGQSMIVHYDGRFYRLLLVVPAFMQEAYWVLSLFVSIGKTSKLAIPAIPQRKPPVFLFPGRFKVMVQMVRKAFGREVPAFHLFCL
jgi:predicted amidohydrolase